MRYGKDLVQAGMHGLLWVEFEVFHIQCLRGTVSEAGGCIGVEQREKVYSGEADWHGLQAGGQVVGVTGAPWASAG